MRIGHGYDVHKLVEERDLYLCGEKIEYEKGLLGHSDADVSLHALSDAILGALALGDIGKHFPDSDEKYKGISSMILLENVYKLMIEKGYEIGNVDLTIVCQRPKLAPFIDKMRENVAKALNTSKENISIKATTTEGLGFEGEGKGISSMILLENVYRLMTEKGYKIQNIDLTIVCQKPKLAPFIDKMRKNISKALKTSEEFISVKATTTEGLGFEGEGKGISATAVVLLKEI